MKQTFIYSICALVIFSSCMSEKEKNEESMKQMIEEAEQQLLITVEKLKKTVII